VDDRARRLVCADWLSERRDPRGDWLRDDHLWEWMRPDGAHPVPRLQTALCLAFNSAYGTSDLLASLVLVCIGLVICRTCFQQVFRKPPAE
jgi:uncharacterized protein (TIGR02996 family)